MFHSKPICQPPFSPTLIISLIWYPHTSPTFYHLRSIHHASNNCKHDVKAYQCPKPSIRPCRRHQSPRIRRRRRRRELQYCFVEDNRSKCLHLRTERCPWGFQCGKGFAFVRRNSCCWAGKTECGSTIVRTPIRSISVTAHSDQKNCRHSKSTAIAVQYSSRWPDFAISSSFITYTCRRFSSRQWKSIFIIIIIIIFNIDHKSNKIFSTIFLIISLSRQKSTSIDSKATFSQSIIFINIIFSFHFFFLFYCDWFTPFTFYKPI